MASIVGRYPPAGPIVDIGGGNGFVSLALQEAGFETLLIEPGADGARNGFGRGLRPVVQATFEGARFHPQSLSAVGLFDVVEHIEKDVAFLSEVHTALCSGGRVYLTVPALGWLWSSEDVEAGHFRRYSRRSLNAALEVAGFQVEYATFMFWVLPLPVFFLRSLAGRLGIRKARSERLSRREHHAPGGASGAVLASLLAFERGRLGRGKGMPIGSSILAIARKR